MKEPNVNTLKKYLAVMSKMKARYITSERLSNQVGVYPEVINEVFAYFDPIVNLDSTYDLLDLVEPAKTYILEKEANKITVRHVSIRKKEIEQYENVVDYIYKNLAAGGFIDKSKVLTEIELKTMQKLIRNDLLKLSTKKKKR